MVASGRRYTLVLTPDPEEGGYIVFVPALPGCITEGDTVEEALANAQDLIRLYIHYLEVHGSACPRKPSNPSLPW